MFSKAQKCALDSPLRTCNVYAIAFRVKSVKTYKPSAKSTEGATIMTEFNIDAWIDDSEQTYCIKTGKNCRVCDGEVYIFPSISNANCDCDLPF